MISANERDRIVITGETLAMFGSARSAAGWREEVARHEAAGATEIAYQPAGPDIADELRRFMDMTKA